MDTEGITPPDRGDRAVALGTRARALWSRCVEPWAEVTDRQDRQLARLLATSILMFLLFAVGTCVAQLHVAPDILAIMPLVAIGALVGVLAFFVAHTRHFQLAALAIAADLILVCVVAIHARPLDPVFEGMITCAVIFASVFLPLGQLVTVAVFAVGATTLGALTVPELRQAGYHLPIIAYQLVAVSLLLLARGHRDRLEQARRDEDLRLNRELSASRRMETLGRLAGGVAHDFNNLLTVINANTSLLAARAELSQDDRGLLDEIVATTDRASQVTGQLLTLGRQQPTQTRAIDLVQTVIDAEILLRRALTSDVTLGLTLCDGPLPVVADEGQIGQVLLNLLVNARDALPDGGAVRLDLHRLALDETTAREAGVQPGDYAALQVIDNGVGMSAQTMERAFEPFYTDRADGRGTGLGLASVFAITDSYGGVVRLDSVEGAGTTVHILLPLAAAHLPSATAAPAAAPARILVVDDDALVRASVVRMLAGAGHIVSQASSVDAAVRAIDAAAQPFELVLTDVVMPGKRGTVLATELGTRVPQLCLSFMSAYTDGDDAEIAGRPILHKPFSADQLLGHVDDLLHARTAAS